MSQTIKEPIARRLSWHGSEHPKNRDPGAQLHPIIDEEGNSLCFADLSMQTKRFGQLATCCRWVNGKIWQLSISLEQAIISPFLSEEFEIMPDVVLMSSMVVETLSIISMLKRVCFFPE